MGGEEVDGGEDPGGVRVTGPGVTSSPGVPASLPTSLNIDTTRAPDGGRGDLGVSVTVSVERGGTWASESSG